MTTGAAPGRFGDSFPRPLNGPHAARWSGAARHRACDVLRMDERSVRGQQQHGEAACKTEESRSFTVDERLAATIPGVRPRVRFLLRLRIPRRIRRARGLFAYLVRTERDPSALSDVFYVRVGFALAGRLHAHKMLLSLLRSHPAPSDFR
jgi:hypothetical protein